MKLACIDLGSNSFLCLIAEVAEGKIKKVLSDEVEIVRLGQGVGETGRFHEEALQRADQCLGRFKQRIDEIGVDKIIAVATAAARDVENPKDLETILEKYEIPLQIISGNKEAELTFLGATSEREDDGHLAVIDIGGGSTEIILRSNFGECFGQSLKMGGVRTTEKFITAHPIDDREMAALEEHVQKKLEEFHTTAIEAKSIEINELIAVAGTPTTLAAMTLEEEFNAEKIEGFKLYQEVLEEWVSKLKNMSVDERCKIVGLEKGRADIIVAGAVILKEAVKMFGIEKLTVSTRGVRYGVAIAEARRDD